MGYPINFEKTISETRVFSVGVPCRVPESRWNRKMEDQLVNPYPHAVYRNCLNCSFLTICAQYLLCLIGVPLDPLISSYPHVVYTFYCTYRKIRIATIYIRQGMSKGILYVFFNISGFRDDLGKSIQIS